MRLHRPPSAALPPLCFGNGWATTGHSPNLLSRLLSDGAGSTVEHAPRGPAASRFHHRTAQVTINGLRLTACSSMAVEVHVPEARRPTLIVPMHGRFSSRYGHLSVEWAADHAAMVLPARPRTGIDTVRSGLWIDIEPQQMEDLARSMVGAGHPQEQPRRLLDFGQATVVPLRAAGADFAAILKGLCRLVDQYAMEPRALAHSGLDEAISRVLVTMLLPHRLLAPASPGEARSWRTRTALERACEYAHAHLDQPLRMADLERVSGLSARMLRQGFRERMGCTPQQWVLEQRLLAARATLSRAGEGTSVAEVAMRFFGRVGGFAARYERRFGESPDRSLMRARAVTGLGPDNLQA